MSHAEKMLASLEEGHLEEAKKHYNETLKFGSHEEKFSLAEELHQLGFLEEARELYENLLLFYPGEGELIIELAEVLVEMDNEEEAIEQLSHIEDDDISYPRALLLMADLYQMQGLFEVSEQKLLQAKNILPDEPVIDFGLGELYSETGRFLEAIRYYNHLIEKGITEIGGTYIHQRLAESYSVGGSFEEALSHYEKALEEHLEINTLFGYAFTAYQAGYFETAIEKLISVKELDPDYHSVYLMLAKAYEHEEQLEESLDTVREGIRQDEFNKELNLFGGKISLKLGMDEEAERFLRDALALDPGYLEAGLIINKLFFVQDRYDDVLEIAQMLTAEGEEEPQLTWDLAKAFEGLEQYNHALKQYRAAYTYFKNHEEFLTEYGQFLLEEGLREDAKEVYKQLLTMDPSNDEWQDLIDRLQD
ncbi:tetratricopeptide repeat protein [Rossellomorea aquimaris]|uniref:tetratricopeptide repeat protein n=1 Tax=Rossellomorea aquimaris TaxID=189382 RepID=UPI001CD44889|nr:tetratricopeptide repeat protein [Rossellomorea aquimaris]MCA1054631.1 tetratricopeptide repeat protein [Rossellomorea aquimaris]